MTQGNLLEALGEVADKVQEQMDKNNTQISIHSGPARMPIINNYALLFNTAFLQTLDDYKLTLNDVRVMLKIIEYMKFGNLVHVSWAKLAIDIGIKPQNITRHIKKLKTAKLLLDDNGNVFLNPQIIAKGKFIAKGDEDTMRLLDLGAQALEGTNIKPNIMTPKMREKQKKEEEKNNDK